jgi:hypothetical protein
MGSNIRLVLKAEEDANLMVNGVVEGVTIASQSSSRSMEPFAEVVVESDRKMPGSVQEYIYLDVYRQTVQTGRVVLVFRPNPIGLSGKLAFDSDAVCDFARYIDGELGLITLPEGKKIELEIPQGEAPWMKIEVNEETGAHRVIAGWKPISAPSKKYDSSKQTSTAHARPVSASILRKRVNGAVSRTH